MDQKGLNTDKNGRDLEILDNKYLLFLVNKNAKSLQDFFAQKQGVDLGGMSPLLSAAQQYLKEYLINQAQFFFLPGSFAQNPYFQVGPIGRQIPDKVPVTVS